MKTKTKLKRKNNWKTKTKKINQNENHTDLQPEKNFTNKDSLCQILKDVSAHGCQ